tara:strand:+ start:39 stop:545 length:507 start_codon:yes stop_codon:yes gene_type:complete
MIKKINFLFVTFFGIGTLRFAPGTAASLITTITMFSFYHIINLSNNFIFFLILLIILSSIFAISFYIKKSENKDPSEIVIDEVIGQAIPIYLYELAHATSEETGETLLIYIYIFILFRFFDIKKPFPINFFDRKFKNAFGVIIDDIIAGLYVVLVLVIFMIIKTKFFI